MFYNHNISKTLKEKKTKTSTLQHKPKTLSKNTRIKPSKQTKASHFPRQKPLQRQDVASVFAALRLSHPLKHLLFGQEVFARSGRTQRNGGRHGARLRKERNKSGGLLAIIWCFRWFVGCFGLKTGDFCWDLVWISVALFAFGWKSSGCCGFGVNEWCILCKP